jgi:hypothetical protein
MLVFTSFIQGIKNVWANKFLIGIMFLFKFLFSLILLAPLYLMFSASFGANARASSLLQKLDTSLLLDFVYHWRQTLSIYFLLCFLVFFLAVVVFIFLSGGFWGILRDGSRREQANSKIERFFGYCAKYFWGMFKTALFLILFYLMAFFLFLFFAAIFDSVAGESSWLEITSWRVVIKIAAFAFLFFLVNMIGDYLRIFYVQNFLERFLGSIKRAFKFLLTNILKTLSLYYLLSVFLIVAILAFVGLNKLTEGIPKTSFYVLLIFLLQQILSLFRAFYRLVYYSSQLVLTDKLSIEKETSK